MCIRDSIKTPMSPPPSRARPQTASSCRPRTASSARSSSVIGDHGQNSNFAHIKSKYAQQRPGSAPVSRKVGKSGTATASKIVRHNGDMFAVKHQHKLTGYKLAQQLGEDVKGECTTTNQAVYKKPQMPTIAAPANRKPLEAYSMNSRRSQLPTEFPHEAKKYVRYCHERNVSQLKIGDPNIQSVTKSASNVFHRGLSSLAVGASNPGIFSEWTKRHRRARGV
eukprot:TRINITY_DN737_c0_g1_i3.p1 TRINITY_DN737_c0_g1~~TRINITY_DN737_c0_g1_i3.p1  ORF type:complete len:223 (+),score=38.19 TRINITY_DN737_c0_g1_i3:179-847(+)